MAGPDAEQPGAAAEPSGWRDPAIVEGYLARTERLAPRRAGEQALLDVVPSHVGRVLDLGCGDGRLGALVLEHRPEVDEVVCVDRSAEMLQRARARSAEDARLSVHSHDLAEPITRWGDFDLIVSGLAIHHLDDDRKRALFGEIAAQLRPGGVFANLEVVASSTPERHQEFLRAIGRPEDDPEDQLASIEDQLRWMTDAGLDQVECIWRWRGFALLVGERSRPDRALPRSG